LIFTIEDTEGTEGNEAEGRSDLKMEFGSVLEIIGRKVLYGNYVLIREIKSSLKLMILAARVNDLYKTLFEH
jgi:hypothetical protein